MSRANRIPRVATTPGGPGPLARLAAHLLRQLRVRQLRRQLAKLKREREAMALQILADSMVLVDHEMRGNALPWLDLRVQEEKLLLEGLRVQIRVAEARLQALEGPAA